LVLILPGAMPPGGFHWRGACPPNAEPITMLLVKPDTGNPDKGGRSTC
jgi:hypothetical protein